VSKKVETRLGRGCFIRSDRAAHRKRLNATGGSNSALTCCKTRSKPDSRIPDMPKIISDLAEADCCSRLGPTMWPSRCECQNCVFFLRTFAAQIFSRKSAPDGRPAPISPTPARLGSQQMASRLSNAELPPDLLDLADEPSAMRNFRSCQDPWWWPWAAAEKARAPGVRLERPPGSAHRPGRHLCISGMAASRRNGTVRPPPPRPPSRRTPAALGAHRRAAATRSMAIWNAFWSGRASHPWSAGEALPPTCCSSAASMSLENL